MDRRLIGRGLFVMILGIGVAAAGCGGTSSLAPPSGHVGSASNGFTSHAPMTVNSAARAMTALHPKSVSPGSVRPAEMNFSLPAPSWPAQTTAARVRPDFPEGPLSWSELPGNVKQLVVSPDGTLWGLAEGAGPDYPIVHYSSGAWSAVPGAAKQLAITPDGATLYAVNSGGGIWALTVASLTWNGLGGGASDITIANDASIYVLSNVGSGGVYPVWHYTGGIWNSLPGSGVAIEASWDPSTYAVSGGTVSPNGFYITNLSGQLFYYSPAMAGYISLPGTTQSFAPVTEGLFALSAGGVVYFYDLVAQGWQNYPGNGAAVAASNTALYVITAAGNIWSSPITLSTPSPSPSPSPTPTPTPTPSPAASPTMATDAGGAYGLDSATDTVYGALQECLPDSYHTPPQGCYLLLQGGAAITSNDQPVYGGNGGLEIQYSSGAMIAFGATLQQGNPTLGNLWNLAASPPVNGDIENPLSGSMDAIVTPVSGPQFACTFTVTGTYDDQTANSNPATYQVVYSSASCGGVQESGSFSLSQASCSPESDADRNRRRPRPNHVVAFC